MISGGRLNAEVVARQLENCDGSLRCHLEAMLAVQCYIFGFDAAAVLHSTDSEQVRLVSLFPAVSQDQGAPDWLGAALPAVRKCLGHGTAVAVQVAQPHAQSVPLSISALPAKVPEVGACIFVYRGTANGILMQELHERLGLTLQFGLVARRNAGVNNVQDRLTRMRMAVDVLTVVSRSAKFGSGAMAMCNQIASSWRCERVSLGFVRRRYVRVVAMSHTEHFVRKMELVRQMESVMEECLDQDCEVLFPSSEQDACVRRAVREFSHHQEGSHILSVPLRDEQTPVAVLMLQRPADKPFVQEEVETVRLACELCTPQLLAMQQRDRWIGAKAVGALRSFLSFVVGPQHTWAKATAVLLAGLLAFSIFVKGQYKVEAPFVVEAVQQQVIPAPFDGYLATVGVEVGDAVTAESTVLGTLDTAELRLQLAAASAERTVYLKQAAAAMRDGQTAQAQIAQAEADRLEAQMSLLGHHLQHAQLRSPIAGLVVSGDLKRQIGAPVAKGDVLFEVAPLESLRAVLIVPEAEVVDMRVAQEGYLATFSYPGQKLHFQVEQIDPVAGVVEQRNVFRVRVHLSERPSWLRPGMEGVGKVHAGKRCYLWIWTRKAVSYTHLTLPTKRIV